MNKSYLWLATLVVMIVTSSCQPEKVTNPAAMVNPFIGTGGHGHTFPGATAPFGGVQLSPDTRKDSWDGCSGYHYSDSVIFGFSHTHLSGTGVGDYGDIRFMPMVGEPVWNPGTTDDLSTGYGSPFSHQNETAEAGYYSVLLDRDSIGVELTATPHAGMHRYHFPKTEEARLIIDLKESVVTEKVLGAELRIVSDHEVMGLRKSQGWAREQIVYFYANFSRPFQDTGLVVDDQYLIGEHNVRGDNLKAVLRFNMKDGGPLLVKVGISSVSYHSAQENCLQEMQGWNFEATRASTYASWNNQLRKIDVDGGSADDKTIFYTALYHTMVAPNIFSDVDGRYLNHQGKVVEDRTFKMYTVFSLWDTFRTLHPLFTIIERERTNDFINSMLDMYSRDGLLPVWELHGNETNCMIGYHSVPVITDAWMKGIRGFDAHQALRAMTASASSGLFGLQAYMTKGYIPADVEGESVSKTLEYAYDDWCIAEMARGMGDSAVYHQYSRRAQYYKNLFDPSTGFFRGRTNGSFVSPFDPTQVNFMLTEANTWQYNFFVPQDINTHIDLLGGDAGYAAKLDELFHTTEGLSGRHQSDITGLIGQYAHGNEPSHHMAYLYNYVGEAWKTQELVHQISTELYKNAPDGLSGNEDCGQMSAWYVMSAVGIYPVTPGSMQYALGSPRFEQACVNLENGRVFSVTARGLSDVNKYVQEATYDGKPWTRSYITYDMIAYGGELVLKMGPEPNKAWGQKTDDRPYQRISNDLIVPVPYFTPPVPTFEKDLTVHINDMEEGLKMKVSANGVGQPETTSVLIDATTNFVAVAARNGEISFEEEARYLLIPPNRGVRFNTPYSPQYSAGGELALINTIRGSREFRTGNWQGYQGSDMDVTIDLGATTYAHSIGAGFLQDEHSWIFMPASVTFSVSTDGQHFTSVGTVPNITDPGQGGGIIRDYTVDKVNRNIRYIRVLARSQGPCPAGHIGEGNPAWIFADEVWVK